MKVRSYPRKAKVFDCLLFISKKKKSLHLEHRKQFENHRKKHYNEFEMVRLHKKEIEDELRALEQEEALASGSDEKEKKT
jgi:hypothetical protein